MKQLIDASKIKDIINIIDERREKHIEKIHSFGYSYNHDSIDDTINHAKAIKELEQIAADIKDITPPIADLEPVHDAVVKLSKHGSMIKNKMIALDKDEYDKHIKIIADYLGLDLDAENAEDDEE